jgi:signal transduction histidine kinase
MKKAKFGIASRTTILLGRESIARVDSAINELIKNTYDADADLCLVSFDVDNDEIIIIDNGIGMTEETILNEWMLIGTDKKKSDFKSEKSRIKAGEKGIGRFALDKLGNKCEIFTKHKDSENTVHWLNDWNTFEQSDKTIDEIEADYELLNDINIIDYVPNYLENYLEQILLNDKKEFNTGTIIRIKELRQVWSQNDIDNISKSLGFLIPPNEQDDSTFDIYFQPNPTIEPEKIANPIGDEFDYKISAKFDGEKFNIVLVRNEYNLRKFTDDIFEQKGFKKERFTKEDFEKGTFVSEYSIEELLNSNDIDLISNVKRIGRFKFSYIFMKLLANKSDKEVFKYKDISDKRQIWMNSYSGVKIYRDNFWVKPYGDKDSESFDWLNLDARRAENPAGVSHPSQQWKVRNLQGQGTLFISRVFNSDILDKSSREGIIENKVFQSLKSVIIAIISLFEKDRAYIGYNLKLYDDKINQNEVVKAEGRRIAKEINKTATKKMEAVSTPEATLAKTVQIQAEKEKELIAEINSYRTLATNGLITTSIVHDLKSIQSTLKSRAQKLKGLIKRNDIELRDEMIEALRNNDLLLHSWISVITEQQKSDKRRRKKFNIADVIGNLINLMKPIFEFKQIDVQYNKPRYQINKRALESDFDAILYNLLINSIEAFERNNISIDKRRIEISLEEKSDKIQLKYADNGPGISSIFKDPYDIFIYGETSKVDNSGKKIGTGMGMYIVSSTISEYNGEYVIDEHKNGFKLSILIPSEVRQ